MNRFLIATLLLLLYACSSTGPTPLVKTDHTPRLVWPAAPEISRVEFITTFHNPNDLGIEKSFIRKVVEFFTGSEEQSLSRPYAVAVHKNRVAIADPDATTIHIYDLDSQSYISFNSAGEYPFESPIGVAIDTNRLFVADSKLNKVFVLNSKNEIVKVINNFSRPTSLTINSTLRHLYISDTLAHTIHVYDYDGNFLYKIGKRGDQDSMFNYPTHLAFSNNRLIVNDTMNFRIQSFDDSGRHIHSFGKQGDASGFFTQSKGVTVDSDGHIYVADALANRIQIFDQNGNFLLEFGKSGDKPGEFYMPSGITVWDDKIFVADSYNQRIQVFQYLKVDE
ncbi:MAG: 6-bladed beta-propeller [Candidatus Thiodiazotropha sp. 6PLUC9]